MTTQGTDGDRVVIFDTTLRDGEQCPGATMTFEEKLEVADCLDQMGVDIIEAGFPIASEGDFEAVASGRGHRADLDVRVFALLRVLHGVGDQVSHGGLDEHEHRKNPHHRREAAMIGEACRLDSRHHAAQAASAASMAATSAGSSGVVRGEKRPITDPSRPIRNFSKFQAISASGVADWAISPA